MDRHRLQQLWQAIAAASDVPGRRDGWAQVVCLACVQTLDQVDGAILALRGTERTVEVLGASSTIAAQLAELQYTVGEGPGLEAFTSGNPVLVADVGTQQLRWPGFAQSALALGTAGIFAFPLQFGAIRLGTLELLRYEPGGLPDEVVSDASVAANLATLAMVHQAGDAERAGQGFAPQPVISYQDVNVATGMLAAQLRISLNEAFARLRAHAYGQGRPILDVARDILQRRTTLDELAE